MNKSPFLSNPLKLGLFPAPFNGGQGKSGVEKGPNMILTGDFLSEITSLGWTYYDASNIRSFESFKNENDKFKNIKNSKWVGFANSVVYSKLKEVHQNQHFPLLIGGDHSLAVGSVAATADKHKDFCLIWVDAHADINTVDSTLSGNLHGCPVSFLLGLNGNVPGFEFLKPCLRPDRIVYIGLRDLDNAEKKILKELDIKTFSMHDVDKYGIAKVIEDALNHVNKERNLPIHLSFDIDALDSTIAPSTGTPVLGGLSYREGRYLIETVCETGLLVALDMVEVNPEIGDQASQIQTIKVAQNLIKSALGYTLV